jgi:hypothetical protein
MFSSRMPMIRTPHFFEDERDAPLLARNYRFVTVETSDAVTARVRALRDLLPRQDTQEKSAGKTTDEEMLRIFRKDAERTYVEKSHNKEMQERTLERQNRHVEILARVVNIVGDYHQGMGYIAAFLGLFLEVEEVVEMMLILHEHDKYSKGYFSATPTKFVADGRVLTRIAEKDIIDHLAKFGILPEMYMSKWFIGLGLHVLPFEYLIELYENFFLHGAEFLFAFGLAYLGHFRSALLEAKSTAALMTVLRAEDDTADWKLPKSIHKEEFGTIMAEAINALEKLPGDLETQRGEEQVKVAEQVRKAKERDEELKRMYADDEDDENWSDDE